MSDFISPVQVSSSFSDVISASVLDSNYPIIAFNIGPEQIRYTVSSSTPASSVEGESRWLNIGESITIPPNAKVWMACVKESFINLQYAENWSIESALRVYPSLTQPKLQTATITSPESFALLGLLFRASMTFNGVASGAQRWIKFVPPSDKEVAITLRTLNPNIAGATYRLYTGVGALTSPSSVIAYNQSDRAVNQTASSVIQISSTSPSLTGATDKGILLRSGSGSGSGVGNQAVGTRSPDNGFTIYKAGGTGFVACITNTSTASNDIDVIIEFAELPQSIVIA